MQIESILHCAYRKLTSTTFLIIPRVPNQLLPLPHNHLATALWKLYQDDAQDICGNVIAMSFDENSEVCDIDTHIVQLVSNLV